ncbi:hypothetical protein ACHAW5_002492 [Stephanodiscus triporus]|uniref:Sugar phosphate transporter domain-containing protein n=1 Tax=Stephanodiscus triporus TaxID=2934178 RepID=A0ABD3R4B2_9STRA
MAIDVPTSLAEQRPPLVHSNNNNNGIRDDENDAEAFDDGGVVPAPAIPAARAYPPMTPSRRRTTGPLARPVVGLFVFYVGHDALQEKMFRYDGYEYGFFMTLVEVSVMLLLSSILSANGGGGGGKDEEGKRGGRGMGRMRMITSTTVWIRIGWVGVLLALSHGLGNASLNYSPYPLKVAFKSCKLVPTMALGACVTGRRHTSMQYAAALVMGIGLATLTAADVYSVESSTTVSSSSSRRRLLLGMGYIGPFVGPMMLGISTIFDSIIPNLQERLLQISKVKTSDMILVSNAIMCVVLLSYTSYSGELASAWGYCIAHPDVFAVLLVQGACAYLGLGCYLSIIRDHGGVVGANIPGDDVGGIPSSSFEKKGGKSATTNRRHEHSV